MTDTLIAPAYVLDRADYADFRAFHARRGRTQLLPRSVRWPVYAVLLAGAIWVVSRRFWTGGADALVGLAYVAVPMVLIVVAAVVLARFLPKRTSDEAWFTLENVVTLAQDGVSIQNANGYTRTAWPAVVKIDDAGRVILIYIRPEAAIIVPKRIFASPADESAFVAHARDLLEKAQHPQIGVF